MILRARIVVPVSSPAVENGAVAVEGSRIVWAGRWVDAPQDSSQVVDLGEVILLPGLINAHCHLDYTGLAGKIPPPRRFTDWVKSLVALKAAWTVEDYVASWEQGAQMLLRSGTTSVADVEAVPELLPKMWSRTPLRVLSFRELIHLRSEGAAETVERVADELAALPGAAGRVGLSPHAPYTTTPVLLKAGAAMARNRGWRLVTHVAESEEEFEMFVKGTGPLYEWLGPQHNNFPCGGLTPVQYLRQIGYLGPDFLAIHVNYVGADDAATLGAAGVHVVHCPRSHAYFGHARFPYDTLAAQRINICLGTDSLVTVRTQRGSTPTLDMFAEMRTIARKLPGLPREEVLRMTTVNAAVALGMAGQIGALQPGAAADLVALPFSGHVADTHDALVEHQGGVAISMIGGQWAIAPG